MVLYLPARLDAEAIHWSGEGAEAVTRLLAKNMSAHLDEGNPTITQEFLRSLDQVPMALYAILQNDNHEVIGSWNDGAIPPTMQLGVTQPGVTRRTDALSVSEPLTSSGGTHGLLTVGFSTADIEASRLHNRMLGMGVALSICLVGIAGAVFIGLSVARPVRQLARMTKESGANRRPHAHHQDFG